jgi:CBS domain-containing protein
MSESMLTRDVMVTRPFTVRPEFDLVRAVQSLMKHRITGAPVVDAQGNYCGVFSERSILEVASKWLHEKRSELTAIPTALGVMTSQLVTLRPEEDVMEGIGRLLKSKISGAPVINTEGEFCGVFSEKTSMTAVLQSAFDQLPGGRVSAYIDPDPVRLITPETTLHQLVDKFLNSPFRRLIVFDEGVSGMISRRDVVRKVMQLIVEYGPGAAFRNSVDLVTQTHAATITPSDDLLSVAMIFQQSNFRRLPVIENRQLLGQLSRRDVLAAFYRVLQPESESKEQLLYLSTIHRREDVPI